MGTEPNDSALTWDDLQAALFAPPPLTPDEAYEIAMERIADAYQEGRITAEMADSLIAEAVAALMRREIADMIQAALFPGR